MCLRENTFYSLSCLFSANLFKTTHLNSRLNVVALMAICMAWLLYVKEKFFFLINGLEKIPVHKGIIIFILFSFFIFFFDRLFVYFLVYLVEALLLNKIVILETYFQKWKWNKLIYGVNMNNIHFLQIWEWNRIQIIHNMRQATCLKDEVLKFQ